MFKDPSYFKPRTGTTDDDNTLCEEEEAEEEKKEASSNVTQSEGDTTFINSSDTTASLGTFAWDYSQMGDLLEMPRRVSF